MASSYLENIYVFLMTQHICALVFTLLALCIALYGFCIYFIIPEYGNSPLADLIKFGKLGKTGIHKTVAYLQVPKLWFRHFYILASCLAILSFYFVWRISIQGHDMPPSLRSYLDFMTTPNRVNTVNDSSAILACVVFSLHVFKRCYESHFVSTFSDGKMHLSFYLIGLCHYIGVFTILLEAQPGFTDHYHRLDLRPPSVVSIAGCIIAIISSYMQLRVFRILASLRKKKDSKKMKHILPRGELFRWVSCPHMTCEVIVYTAILFITEFQLSSWFALHSWVVANQGLIAILNHKWYKETFRECPKNWKAIIPYVL